MQRESELIALLSQVNKPDWDSKSSPSEFLSQSSTLDSTLSSRGTFGGKVLTYFPVFALTCCSSPSLGRLKHRSVSLLSGGEQGRDSVRATQLDWVVWEVWVVLLRSLSLTLPPISLWGFSKLNHSLFSTCLVQNEESLLSNSERHDRMASAWFRQPTHVHWVWVRVPAFQWKRLFSQLQ